MGNGVTIFASLAAFVRCADSGIEQRIAVPEHCAWRLETSSVVASRALCGLHHDDDRPRDRRTTKPTAAADGARNRHILGKGAGK
jgi:hypothetical protein